MTRIVFFAISIIFLQFSCRKSGNPVDNMATVEIHYIDSSGNDLFTDGQNGYWMDSVRIFDFENGTKILIYQGPTTDATLSHPYGYNFGYNSLGEIMYVFGNNDIINRYNNSIIHLKAGVADTLKGHLTGNTLYGSFYDSVWYNGHLQLKPDSIITVIK